jgi:primosomal protein N' (replication factor Y) (superfamily II helicase)
VALIRVALPVAAHRLFDYWLPDGLAVQPGSVVIAKLARRRLAGVVTDLIGASDVALEHLSPIAEVLNSIPALPDDVRELAHFASDYYQAPIGLCYAHVLPPLTASGRTRSRPAATAHAHAWALNDEQRSALGDVLRQRDTFSPSLLQGITGSGKTEVYLAAAAEIIAAGQQALFLVPEINLTPQLADRIAAALPNVVIAVLHSRLAAGERHRRWMAAATGVAQLVVGTRLAVFTPMPRLKLIIVDEEHDASFKQQDGVRYHARDLAVYRARLRALPIVLGSATPSLESFAQAERGRYRKVTLTRRAGIHGGLPRVRLVPNRDPASVEGIGAALQKAMAARLARGEQTLLFVNRRGFAPSLLCAACRWKAMCPRCDARLVVHRDHARLACHHCGHATAIVAVCPECGNQDLLPIGFGTQRLEAAVAQLHPSARIVRVDRDSTRRKGSFDAMRLAISDGHADILIGTHMLAKGHDFPRLTLVGVLGADNALYSAEFRATEALFALLEQVAGRAGRGVHEGEVLVQTDFPDHPLYRALIDHDYAGFARSLLAERAALGLPPYSHLALLSAEARSESSVGSFLAAAVQQARALVASLQAECEIYPAVPATLPRRADRFRAQVLAQSASRRDLQLLLTRWRGELESIDARTVRWNVDVDPLGFA